MKKFKLMTLLLVSMLSINLWGAEGDTHVVTPKHANASGTQLNNNATIKPDTIAELSYPIKKLVINAKTNKSASCVSISVFVGNQAFGDTKNAPINTTGDVIFESSTAMSGDIIINYANNSGSGSSKGTLTINSYTVTEGAAATPAYTITAQSNNTTYGTVKLDGSTITATPKSGYRISATDPYEVTSGTAEVEQNGNTFKVTPSTNCTVQINFEEKGCSDHAGTNVTSGSSTSNSYGPIATYYNYSTRQILYTKTDLGLAAGKKGTIKSIYFEYASNDAITKKNSVKIYMANTNLTALSTSAYVPYSDFTEVYSGALNCSNGWNEISLTTPFVYNGSGSLVVLIDDNSRAYESSREFKYHTANTTSGAQIYTYSDSDDADPSSTNWSSYTPTNNRPNTKFCIEEADMTTATVTWYVNSVSWHSQTNYPGTICTAPTTPTTSDCDGSKVFVGWTATQDYENATTPPSDLFTDPTTKTIPDGGANYYAVFANESISGKGIAQVVDNSFTGNYTSYCNMTYGLRTAGTHYVQKNSIWSGLTTETIKINIKHISNTSADVLTVSLIDKDGNNVVSTDVTTQTISSSKDDASYLTNPISLTATSAVTGYKIKLKTKNGFGTCIGEVSRVVEAAITRTNYATTCAPIFNISSSITGQGSIQWSLDLENWSATIANQPENTGIYFKLVPTSGWEIDGKPSLSTGGEVTDMEEYDNIYGFEMPASAVTVSASFKQPATYMILYNLGNFTDATGDLPDPEEVAPGTNYSVNTTNKLSLTGYTFKGWNTDKNATTGLTNITVNDDITLYAIFTINYHNVIFTPAPIGGSVKVKGIATSPVSIPYNEKVYVIADANTHYTLTTLTANGNSIKDDKFFTMPDVDVTIVAEFTEDTKYDVKFYNNGNEITEWKKEVYVNDPIGTLPSLTSSDAKDARSKTFVGWTAETINVWQDNAPALVSGSETVTKALTLNAVWAKKEGSETQFKRVKNLSELTAGQIVIVDNKNSKLFKNNISVANAPTETDGIITVTPSTDVWILGGNSTDGWTLSNSTGKLGVATLPNNSSRSKSMSITNTNSTWTFGVNNNGTNCFYVRNGNNDCALDYNSGWCVYYVTGDNFKTGEYYAERLYIPNLSYSDYITHSSSSPLESITLNTDKVKENYFVGETFTSANLTATAKLKDGIEFPIEYKDLVITPADLSTAGVKTVTVTYTFNGATRSKPYTVNVYSVTINKEMEHQVDGDDVTGNKAEWDVATKKVTVGKANKYYFDELVVDGATSEGSFAASYYTLSNPTKNVTVTAKWHRLFTLQYEENGGSTVSDDVDKPYNTAATLPTPSRTGYNFAGWFNNEQLSGERLTSYAITKDETLFAKWSEIMPTGITLSPNVTEITDLIYDDPSKRTKKIFATIDPNTALEKTFAWSVVEGSDVVEVATDGTITAKAAGTAKVKVASTRVPTIYKEISVTVHALPQITWLNMDGTQFGETTTGTSDGKVGTMPSGTPTSCDAEKYPYFRGWSATNFGKTTDNPEANFVTKDTEVALDGENSFYAVCAAGTEGDEPLTVFSEDFASITNGNSTSTGGSGTDWTGNTNFPSGSSNIANAYQAGGAVRIGKSGKLTTKNLDLSAGEVVVSFKVKGWSNSEKTVSVQVGSQTSKSVSSTSYMSTGDFEQKSLTFNADGEKTVVKFTTNNSNRVFLDDIVITCGKDITYTEWATQCCQAPKHELAITTTALTVKMGNTLQLSTGETGNGNTIKWESKNTAVATVDQSGLVTPFGTGKATITVSQEAKTVDNVDFCEQYAEVEVEVIANNEFGISFTATEGGSAVAKINDAITQKATTGTIVTIEATEASSDYIFDSWTVVSGGVSLESTTANPTTFEMGSADVKITPTFYKKTVDNIAIKTAPSVTTYTTRDHLNVTGLVITATYTKHGSEDIAYAGNEDKFSFSPALDANLTAGNQQDVTVTYDGKSTTFKIDVAQYTTPYYSLVTDASQLEAGKKVVFGTAVADHVMGYYVDNANNIPGVAATYNEDRSGVEVEDAAYIVSGNATDGWHFADAQGRYIYVPEESGKNYLYAATDKQDKGTWSVSVDETTQVLTMNCTGVGLFDRTLLSYNTNNPGFFSCYKTTQNAVYMYIEDVKPVYVPVTSIELNETAMNVMQSKSGSLIATVGPDNATQHNVTWSIINDNANGKITVTEAGTVLVDEEAAVGATATVRATTDGTDKDGNHLTAECVITVTELETVDYMLVTTASLLQAGDIIVLGNADNSALNGAIGTDDYFDKVQATYNSAKKTMSSKYAVEITLGGNAIDGWTFTTMEGNIYASGSDGVKVSTTKDPSIWTIAIATDGTATIKENGEGYAIHYNSGNPRFKRYSAEKSIQIYSKRDTRYKRTGLTYDQAGTICLPYAVKADDYTGASVWSIDSRTGTGTMISSITLVQEVEDDGFTKKDLVAGKPYIFFAEEETFAIFCSGNPVDEVVEANGLIGNLSATPIIINQGQYQPGSYLINQNKLMECGKDCNVPQYRAYVKAEEIGKTPAQAPVSAPRRVIGNPSGTPTNLNGLNGNGKAQKALIDGHIYILRDNKMYNAQGIKIQ